MSDAATAASIVKRYTHGVSFVIRHSLIKQTLGISLSCLFVATLLLSSRNWEYALWLAMVIVGATTLFCLGALMIGPVRRIFSITIVLYSIILSLAVFNEAIISTSPLAFTYRAVLWFGNPNLLGAALTMSLAAVVSLKLRQRWVTWIVVGTSLLAVIFTGSRTALLAGVAVIISGAIESAHIRFRSRVWIPSLVLIGLAGALLALSIGGVISALPRADESTPDNLQSAYWSRHLAKELQIEVLAEGGPYAGGIVSRIRAVSNDTDFPGLIMFYSLEAVPAGQAYTASVYLRSSGTDSIILSTNYVSANCEIEAVWSRCVVTGTVSNARTHVQLQLRTRNPGEYVSFDLWGPQLEPGLTPTFVERASRHPIVNALSNSGLAQRYLYLPGSAPPTQDDRFRAMQGAWDQFLANPIFGNPSAESIVIQNGAYHLSHAHNWILEHLRRGGITSLAVILLAFLNLCRWALLKQPLNAMPLIIAALILNSLDYTFYNAGGFYIFWLALGLAASDVPRHQFQLSHNHLVDKDNDKR